MRGRFIRMHNWILPGLKSQSIIFRYLDDILEARIIIHFQIEKKEDISYY